MKTTKTIFFAITIVLLSLFATSCIPTVPGGNPTPTPQTDTSVVYKNPNVLVALFDNQLLIKDTMDLDSNGINDISFEPYEGTPGYLTTTNHALNSMQIMSSLFNLNDTINATLNTFNFVAFSAQSDGTTTTYVGFKLLQNDGYHYGWLQLKMEVKFYTIFSPTTKIKTTLINYAYKIAPNTPIQAGKY
jgi:hypothetical protein